MSEQPRTGEGRGRGLSYAEPSLLNRPEPIDPIVGRAIAWACIFFLTPIPCVVAIVYGVVGIRRTRRLRTRGQGRAWGAVIVGVLGVIGWVWVAGVIIKVRRSIDQLTCMSDMRELGADLMVYAEKNRGCYPARLQDLLMFQVSPNLLVCPASGIPAPRAGAKDVQTSYVLLAADMPVKSLGPSDVAVFEVSAHPTGLVTVLYGDGHVATLKVGEAAAEAQKTLDKVAALRASTRPAATRPGV